MSSGNNNMYFGSNNGSGNFPSNQQEFFNGEGGGGIPLHEELGDHRMTGVDEHMKQRFLYQYPPYPLPPPLQHPPPFPHPIPVFSWGPDNHMHPGGPHEQNGTNQNREEPNGKMVVEGSSNDDWWKDAPMPSDEIYNYPTSSSNESASAASLKNEPITPRTPFTPQNEGPASLINMDFYPSAEQQAPSTPNPHTPNPADIQNLERLNLNPTPTVFVPNESAYVNPRDLLPIDPDEPVLVEVRCPPETETVKEVFDETEKISWVNVNYFVEKQKMMDTYQTDNHEFVIDNSKGQDENRCGLDIYDKTLPTSTAVMCRSQMGNGIKITRSNGAVWLTLLSEYPIFMVCPFKNMMNKVEQYTICRYKRERRMDENNQVQEADEVIIKIFDDDYYHQEMTRLLGLEGGLQRCADILPSLCCTRVAFVKGCGEEYPRKTIPQSPCWVEIRLMKQFSDFDVIYRQRVGNVFCGSRS